MDKPEFDSNALVDAYVTNLVAMLDVETTRGDDTHAGAILMSTLCTAAVRLSMGGANMDAVRKGFEEAIADGQRRVGAGVTRQ